MIEHRDPNCTGWWEPALDAPILLCKSCVAVVEQTRLNVAAAH